MREVTPMNTPITRTPAGLSVPDIRRAARRVLDAVALMDGALQLV